MAIIITPTRELIVFLVSEPNIELPNINSEYRQSGEDLFDTLEDISDESIESAKLEIVYKNQNYSGIESKEGDHIGGYCGNL